jgi:hypothetical protein
MRFGSTACASRKADLTRRAKQGHNAIIPKFAGDPDHAAEAAHL